MVETRNQQRSRMTEQRVQHLEQEMQTVQASIQELTAGINASMETLRRELQEGLLLHQNGGRHQERQQQERHHDRRGGGQNYHKPTQFTKMEFPRYHGQADDILTWLLKCERFFELDETPEESKVKMASMHLDDKSFQWHRALERRLRNRLPPWDEYAILLQDTFGPPFETPMSDLAHLRQTGTLAEYNAAFDYLSAQLDLPEDYLVDIYISSLKKEMVGPVRILNPRTLNDARKIARMQEIILENNPTKSYGQKDSRNGSSSYSYAPNQNRPTNTTTTTPYRTALLLKKPSTPENTSKNDSKTLSLIPKIPNRTFKPLTPEEEAEHRSKNLCFYCHGPFSRDHRCVQRQKSQLHYIHHDQESEADMSEECPEDPEAEEPQPCISLHAIEGVDQATSMRVQGQAGKRPIQILIDSGSTHDFLDFNLAKKLGWTGDNQVLPSVEVAGGRKLKVHGLWKGFKWKMQGLEFVFDIRILDLNTYDLVLGLQWLKSIKNAFWDYNSLSMYFWYKGDLRKLQATPPNSWHLIHPNKPEIHSMQQNQMFLLRLVQKQPEGHFNSADSAAPSHMPAEVQWVLSKYQDVFDEPKSLPPFREGHNHSIVLKEGTDPISLKPYRYPAAQRDTIEKIIAELMQAGVIQPSSSPFSAPIVLVKKKDGTWRMCIDFRELNKATVKNQYPIPLIEELFEELGKARWFTKLDLRAGYHQLRMEPADVHKTAFKSHSGHYEWLVMPFGLTNAPATFQGTMNDLFRVHLRKFVLVFFDDILIYSSTLTEHAVHLEEVFTILRNNSFYVKRSKCIFASTTVEYLGHIIGAGTVSTDPSKIQAVADWPLPTTIKQLRGFLGLAGYYRRFIRNFGTIARPLTSLLKKNGFVWTQEATDAVQHLKTALTSAPVLVLPDFVKPFVVEADACGLGIGAVLMQEGKPLAYFSKGLSPKHQQLSVYEKELMAVVLAVLHWHQYLERNRFVIRTDQQSLKYLLGQKLKTSFQMFWVAKLAGFDYEIQYKKGQDNSVADALSRMPKMQLLQMILDTSSPELLQHIKQSWEQDEYLQQLIPQVQATNGVLNHFTWSEGLLRRKGKLVVGNDAPLKQKILDWLHGSPQGGHSGIQATYQRIKTLFWWRKLMEDVTSYVKACDTCARCKYETVAAPGLLQPLPIPSRIWESITMDFIEGLPKSNGKEVIWVIIDRMSKYAHFVALSHPYTAASLAQVFLDHIYKLHGVPTEIISDRDPIFVSNFWKEFLRVLGIQQKLSSAYHPQTDGQSEVLNRCLETYLRCMCWEKPKEWSKWLPHAEWWYNTSFHTSTRASPYELLYGQKPPIHCPYLPHNSVLEAVDRSFETREQVLAMLKHHLHRASNRMKQRADLHRSDREFLVGQWVFLKLQPYRQLSAAVRSSQKLAPRYFGPYQVLEKVGPVAYKLELPPESRVHPTFHVSLLKLCPNPAVRQRHPPPDFPEPPPSLLPERILNRRSIRRRKRLMTEVLVQWKGLPDEEASWVPLQRFQEQFPDFVVTHP